MSLSSVVTNGPYEEKSWIEWFVHLRGNEYFCVIDDDFLLDDFNLTGLHNEVPLYEYALDMILDIENALESDLTPSQCMVVKNSAIKLYGLIHSRFILTGKGMKKMRKKYDCGVFGQCPRVNCYSQNTLPVGLSDIPKDQTVVLFCPKCRNIFYPINNSHATLDGAYFGTTFGHLFLLTYPDLIPPPCKESYIPCIFGFKINKQSIYYEKNRIKSEESDCV